MPITRLETGDRSPAWARDDLQPTLGYAIDGVAGVQK